MIGRGLEERREEDARTKKTKVTKVRGMLRPSPNEESNLKHADKQRLRLQRFLQVGGGVAFEGV